MKLKDIPNIPYRVYLRSHKGSPSYTKDIDLTPYMECECEWDEWEDDDGCDENGRIIRRGVDLTIDDRGISND